MPPFEIAPGITGFSHVSAPPLPETDPSDRRRAAHAAARALGGQVAEELEPPMASYAAFRIERRERGGSIGLALHRAHRLAARIAWTPERPIAGDLLLAFEEPEPALSAALDATLWTLPPRAALEATPDPAALAALPAWERAQIAHWRPETLGALIFNRWD
ncbi:MAG: hypothetical protein AAFW46_16870 [Pseudomonadota bacterium]